MPVKTIKYKGKDLTVREWSVELGLSINTIYGRLKLNWPPELVLSNKRFNYFDDSKAVNKLLRSIDKSKYPISIPGSNHPKCCDYNYKCGFAMPLNNWEEVKDNPSSANYYCNWLGKFVEGNEPICNK